MSILIRNIQLNGKTADIAIRGNRIAETAPGIQGNFDTVIDGTDKAAVPPFYNTHCHAAMTLLRGIADDLELFDWLRGHIWPAENRLTPEDIYWGSRLACLEMIKSGTVFFNDMYFMQQETVRAVEDAGIRASVGLIVMTASGNNERLQQINREILESRHRLPSRIQLAWAPHAIYTVSGEWLRKTAELAAEYSLPVHIHMAETEQEVRDCRNEHGCTPAEYLDRCGLLTEKTLAAHAIHLTDSDMELLGRRKVRLSYMPCSNAKLCSGLFHFRKLLDHGCRITLGTDGCASNNSLSMFDEMKFGALRAKQDFGGPAGCTAEQIFRTATRAGAEAFGIDGGIIEPGRLADLMLVDLNQPAMAAGHNLISDLVYAADSSCVDTVICDGRILMRNRVVPGEKEVIRMARKCAEHLAG